MSYVISDYNVLVHSVLPSLPAGLHPFLLISLHFGTQRAPTLPVLTVYVFSSFAFPALTLLCSVLLFCSRLSSLCIAVLMSRSCVEVFFCPVLLLACFIQLCSVCPCSCCSGLFCTVAFFLPLQMFLSGLLFI